MTDLESSLPVDRHRIRILIADDDHVMRELLARLLEGEGFNVVGRAADGDEALRLFGGLRPDVFFLDVEMPGKTGLEVIEALPHEDAPRVVIVSATASTDRVRRAVEMGVAHFVVKPFSPKKLTEAVAISLLTRGGKRARLSANGSPVPGVR